LSLESVLSGMRMKPVCGTTQVRQHGAYSDV